MYKVLDVREQVIANYGTVSSGSYSGGTGHVSLEVQRKTIVIAEDADHNRKRFEFYEGYQEKNFRGDYNCYGYRGDYDLLVPGDYFEIEKTSTYPNVRMIKL